MKIEINAWEDSPSSALSETLYLMTRFSPKILMISRIYCLKTQFFQKKKNEFLHIFVGNTYFNGTHGHSNDLHHALEKNLDMCNSNEKMKRLINNNKKALFEKLFHVR